MKPQPIKPGDSLTAHPAEERRGIYLSIRFVRVCLILSILLASGIYLSGLKKNIASSYKGLNDEFSQPYGYSIDSPFLSGRTTFTLKGAGTMQIYDLGRLKIERVLEQQWLAGDSALHLVLEIQYTESYSESRTTKADILYDFETGELYTVSDLPLWRSYNFEANKRDIHRVKRWMSQKEFKTKLEALSRVTAPPRHHATPLHIRQQREGLK